MQLRRAWIRFFVCALLIIGLLSGVMLIVFYNNSSRQEAAKIEATEAFVRKQKLELIENVVNNMVAWIYMYKPAVEENARLDLERAASILRVALMEEFSNDGQVRGLIRIANEYHKNIDILAYNTQTGYAFGLSGEEAIEFSGTPRMFEEFFEDHSASETFELGDRYLIGCGIKKTLVYDILRNVMQNYADSQIPLGDVEIQIDALNNYSGQGDFAMRIIVPYFQRGEKTSINAGNADYYDTFDALVANGEAFTEFMHEGTLERFIYAKLYRPYDWIVSASISAQDIRQLTNLLAEQFREQVARTSQAIALMGIVFTGVALLVFVLLGRLFFRHADHEFKVMDDLSHIDALTGINNRRYMEERLQNTMDFLSRSCGLLSALMIDIDHFKLYNDTYGHQQGDVCLRAIAQALKSALPRESDFAARYGGEEFIVVLPNTSEDGALVVAEKLLKCVRAMDIPHEKNSAAPYVTISLGVTSGCVTHTQNWKDYVASADEALYISKQSGRNKSTYIAFKERV